MKFKSSKNKNILVALVQNEPGVLNRISSLFRRRRFNIESISAGQTENKGYTRLTIVVDGTKTNVDQVIKQMEKIVTVVKVKDVTHENIYAAEVVMVKVNSTSENRADIQNITELFNAKIVNVGKDEMMLLLSGEEEKINSFLNLLQDFGIKEMVRTGLTTMEKDAIL